jgi:hypothetical protein
LTNQLAVAEESGCEGLYVHRVVVGIVSDISDLKPLSPFPAHSISTTASPSRVRE